MGRPALSATRAIEMLNFLASHPVEVFTLSELATRLEINVASTHAVLGALEDSGYVIRHATHKTYGLGPAVVALGNAALERHRSIDVAREEMERLESQLGLEILATVRIGDAMVAVARTGRPAGSGASLQVGQRVPLRPPLGSIFVAWDSEAGIDRWLASSGSNASPEERRHHRDTLAPIRERGYSVGLEAPVRTQLGVVVAGLADEPHAAHLRASMNHLIADLGHGDYQLDAVERGRTYQVSLIAAPVFDAAGRVSLVLSLLGFRAGLTADEVQKHGDRLREAGLRVTRATGGRIRDAD